MGWGEVRTRLTAWSLQLSRRLFLATCLLPAAVALQGCGGDSGNGNTGGPLRVVATTAVVGQIAEELGQDRVELTVLIPPGADPHDFQLTTEARRAIEDAALILQHGLGLDEFLDLAADPSRSEIRVVSAGATLRVLDGEADPHVWLDADNAQTMIENVASAFIEADPEGADIYRTRADAYTARVRAADEAAAAAISAVPAAERVVITNHDSLGYLLDRYGIRSAGSVIPGLSTAAEPSARDIARLIQSIREDGVRLIVAEGSVEPRIARQIAADTGATIIDDLYGDTLGEPGTDTGSVDGVILFDITRIAEALLSSAP